MRSTQLLKQEERGRAPVTVMPLYHMTDMFKEEVLFEGLNQSSVFCDQFENSEWYCYILLVLFSFALPLGILGNIVALISYTCFKKSPNTSKVFLFNLALCDSAWILTLPLSLYFTLQRPLLRDMQIFCQFRKVSFSINIYGSIFFLTLISLDRFVGTVYPISSLRWWGVQKAKLCSVCTWVLLILCSVPDLFLTFAIQRHENVTVCTDHIHGPFVFVRTNSIIKTTVGFLVPFVLMVTFYIKTVRVLRRLPGDRRLKGAQRSGGKPLRLITAALIVFVVSFVPYHVMVITLVFMRAHNQITPANSDILYTTYEFFEAMCSVSCCLDPVLYIMASERFHKRLVALRKERYKRLCCRASRRVGVMGS